MRIFENDWNSINQDFFRKYKVESLTGRVERYVEMVRLIKCVENVKSKPSRWVKF